MCYLYRRTRLRCGFIFKNPKVRCGAVLLKAYSYGAAVLVKNRTETALHCEKKPRKALWLFCYSSFFADISISIATFHTTSTEERESIRTQVGIEPYVPSSSVGNFDVRCLVCVSCELGVCVEGGGGALRAWCAGLVYVGTYGSIPTGVRAIIFRQDIRYLSCDHEGRNG